MTLIDWLILFFYCLDPRLKSKRAFAMFASEYLIFKRACEADDLLLVDQSYKRIRQILEEAAPLLSESFSPDSFIWRLWHYIERTKKNRVEMEQVCFEVLKTCVNQCLFLGLFAWCSFLSILKTVLN